MAGRLDEAQKIYAPLLEVYPGLAVVAEAAQILQQQIDSKNRVKNIFNSFSGPFYRPEETCQVQNLGNIYEELFNRKTNGVFVEVGAYDGRLVSNTSCLASIGWRGLYVEPVPEYYKLCVDWNRGNENIDVANCAVGQEEGFIEIHVAGAWTTALNDQKLHYDNLWNGNMPNQKGIITVPKRRMETLLQIHNIPTDFDVLVIDVEGMELDVVSSFDLNHWRPKLAIVELEDEHPDHSFLPHGVERCQAVREIFKKSGYDELQRDKINTVFVRRG